ncbi:hypothetical protein, variant [Verruconis gallopava]|uniref:Uncharacterized protein n=1 Tax=Verruconis gallopava TaxID=253628 RepID=A0A0D2AU30_9PEZI|nr:hypothetical protein, variant [Verruconis gallopava]KIW02634.1 hypothetical protein, variant [Verruconis gallopava]
MRLSLASFLAASGTLVLCVEAADPTRSLQWQRRGQWYRRDGSDSNATQPLAAPLSPDAGASSSSSTSTPASISSAPPFPPPTPSASPMPLNLPNKNPVASNTSNSSLAADVQLPSGSGSPSPSTNASSIVLADNSTVTPPFPLLNSTKLGFNATGSANGSSCGGCVVNAQGFVDWWFPSNIFLDIASISTITLNGTASYTAVPLSTWTNLNDQLTQDTFIYTEYLDPVASTTVEDYIFTTLPPPIAASTSVTTISDVNPLPNGTFGSSQLNMINAVPSTPSIVVDPAIPTPISATQVDNIAWYTAYEVEFDQSTTDDSGAPVCQRSTSTYTLDEPYAYTLDPSITFGDSLVATGPVDQSFLNYIPYASCTTGSWTASPTVVVVVEVAVQRGFNVFLVHHEVSDPGTLDTPTVTSDGGAAAATSNGASVVSAVATVNGNTVTFQATVTGNPASVTLPVGGSSVVASVVGGGSSNNNNNGGGSGGGGIASAIISALGGGNSNGGNSNSGSGSGSVNGVGFANSASPSSAGSGGVPVITVGGQTFVGNQATEFSLAPGATLTPGGVATIGANTVSLASNAQSIVVNGVTSQLVPGSPPAPTAITFQGQTITENSQGAFVISGSSLVAGGQAITVGSNTVSLNANGQTLTVNGIAITAPAALPTAPTIQIDGTTFQAQGGGESFVLGGQTLVPGGQVVSAGTTISLASDGSVVFVNGVAQPVAAIVGNPTVDIGGTKYTELQGGYFVLQGTTLRPGQTSVIAGTTIAFGSDGSYVVVNGATSKLSLNSVPVLVIGGTTYAATSGIGYVIGGQTLRPGSVITANGHTISLSPNGLTMVVDGLTTVLNTPITTNPPLIVFNGKTYTANSGTTYNIDGHILTPGGCIQDSGHTICLAPHATAVTIDGKVTKLFPAATLPAQASAVTTSSSKFVLPTSNSPSTATATKKGAATSIPNRLGLAIFATLVSFFGALCAWM